MPIVATCPYCRNGAVRAPDKAAGLSVNCPKCKSSFTLIPDVGLPGWSKPEAVPAAAETLPFAAAGEDVTEPSPVLVAAKPRRAPSAPPVEEPDDPPVPGFAVALLALVAFGLAMLASQFPYGQFIAPGLAAVGLLIGLLALGGEGRAKLAALAGVALNLLVVGLVFLAPDWLGLDSWRTPVPEGPKTPQAVGHGTGAAANADWVNANTASWMVGDVRIAVRSVSVAPLELVGPNGDSRIERSPVLQVHLRITNDGVERRVELTGWAAGGDGAALVDPAGKPIVRKRFEAGWEPKGGGRPAGLFPGKTADVLLVYECPPNLLPKSKTPRPEFLRLRLPGEAVGVPDAAQFHIPGTSVFSGKVP